MYVRGGCASAVNSSCKHLLQKAARVWIWIGPYCFHFLLMQNHLPQTQHLKTTHLFSHRFCGLESRHSGARSSGQGPTKLKSRCPWAVFSSGGLTQEETISRLIKVIGRTQFLMAVFWLTVSRTSPSATTSHPRVLASRAPLQAVHDMLFAFRPAGGFLTSNISSLQRRPRPPFEVFTCSGQAQPGSSPFWLFTGNQLETVTSAKSLHFCHIT